MISTFDYLGLRRMPINYFSPAVCDADFSSTSEPSIVLEPFTPYAGPTGLTWGEDGGNIRLRWTSFPGALCYSVYRAVDALDPYGEYVLFAECTEDTEIVLPPGTYRVTAITEDGETEPTEFIVAGGGGGGETGCADTLWESTGDHGGSDFVVQLDDTVTILGRGQDGTGWVFESDPGNEGEGIPPSSVYSFGFTFSGTIGPCSSGKYVIFDGTVNPTVHGGSYPQDVVTFQMFADAIPVVDTGYDTIGDPIPFTYSVFLPAGNTLAITGLGNGSGGSSDVTVDATFTVVLSDTPP